MLRIVQALGILALVLAFAPSARAQVASQEVATMENATLVLNEIMAIPANSIPTRMLADCQGIVIVPNVIKGGFVVGARFGRGVAVIRDANGNWLPPTFVTLTGGSIGWQIGLQATDVILVFRSRRSVENLMRGKFTIGVDAAAAAGPVGRQAAAATDAQLRAEILSYSRSRGLFAGVSIDGSAIQINREANNAFFAGTGIAPGGAPVPAGQEVRWPPSAVRLIETIAAHAEGKTPAGAAAAGPSVAGVPQAAAPLPIEQPLPVPPPVAGAANLNIAEFRQQLGDESQQLAPLLDENWRAFLFVDFFTPNGGVNVDALQTTVKRYDTVAQDPKFAALAQRAEFRTLHQTLRRAAALLAGRGPALALPPPPNGFNVPLPDGVR